MPRPATRASALLLACFPFFLCACAEDPPPSPSPGARAHPVRFAEVAARLGLDFTHFNGASPRKYFPETMGGGGAFLDYDGDGRLDIYLVNGSRVVGPPPEPPRLNALYHQRPDGTFAEVAVQAGVAHPGCGMGVAAADFDNDGRLDIYLTNYGPNVLYRNVGGGAFADITRSAGVGDSLWGTSCAFADYDRDGDLDLYVANYVSYDPAQQRDDAMPYMAASQRHPGPHARGYPHPGNFAGAADRLFRNEGGGRFRELTREAGIYDQSGKGLGVVWGDYDDDGWPDLYVANDGGRNFLFHNQGDGTFAERGAASGVAYGQDGQMEAGMGVDWGDYDNDGRLDLTVTNFQSEPNALYHNQGEGFFASDTYASGVGLASLPFLGFGTNFLDYDNDGRLDLFVANGHVLDNLEEFDQSTTYAQRNLLFHNQGPGPRGQRRFVEVSQRAGAGLLLQQVSRGSAAGDYDNDGDLDLLVVNLGQRVALLRNEGGNEAHWLGVRLRGAQSNREGIGARLRLRAGDLLEVREVKSGDSYLAQSDLRVHFGLGEHLRVDSLEVSWPSGKKSRFAGIEADRFIRIDEQRGLVPY